MIAEGARFGHLVVLEEMSAAEAEKPYGEGSWCRCRCDCGSRTMKRSRHLRAGFLKTCGLRCRFRIRATPEALRRGWAKRRLSLERAAAHG